MDSRLHSLQEIDQCFRQTLPSKGNKHLLRLLPFVILGVMLSGSCHLNRIAVALGFVVTYKTMLQRLRRWVIRGHVAQILPGVARGFIASCATDPLLLFVDRTEWKYANLLVAAVNFRGRAIPVAIQDLGRPKATNSQELKQLLEQVAKAVPSTATVVVVGDREFGNIPAIKVIRARGWHFCLRFKKHTWFCDASEARWRARDAFPPRGRRVAWSQVHVTLKRYGPLNCAIIYDRGEKEPWILISDLPTGQLRAIYSRRMRIEELFSDLKKRGFNLEATRLRDSQRILRLTVLLCIAYIWMLAIAQYAIRRGWRRHVDYRQERTLSYYQVAVRTLIAQPLDRVPMLFTAAKKLIRPK